MRSIPSFILALAAASLLGACATAAPTPCEPTVRASRGALVFRGEAPAAADARERARLSAIVEALKRLGVEIGSEVQDEWTHVDGADATRIVVRSNERVARIEVRGAEAGYCEDQGGDTVRAAVAIPAAEWRRLERIRRGRTLLVLRCATEPAGPCGDALLERLRAVAAGTGLTIATALGEPPPGVDAHSGPALVDLGRQHQVSRILWLDLASEFRTRHEGVLYAYTTVRGKLVETSDGKTERTVAVEDIKGAVYEDLGHTKNGRDDAVRESISQALSALRDELAAWGG